MSVIATDTPYFSNLVKAELMPEVSFCRGVVVVNDTAATLKVGTVLGKVTATGKYKESVQTAVDGSQNPVAVVVGKDIFADAVTLTATTDTKVLAIVRGDVIVSKAGLLPNASFNDATKLAAAYASLASVGILANDSI